MKRYDLDYTSLDPGNIREEPTGQYYLVSDVEATMIPRPDPDKVRKAVDELLRYHTTYVLARESCGLYADISQAESRFTSAQLKVFKLMGVEVKDGTNTISR